MLIRESAASNKCSFSRGFDRVSLCSISQQHACRKRSAFLGKGNWCRTSDVPSLRMLSRVRSNFTNYVSDAFENTDLQPVVPWDVLTPQGSSARRSGRSFLFISPKRQMDLNDCSRVKTQPIEFNSSCLHIFCNEGTFGSEQLTSQRLCRSATPVPHLCWKGHAPLG
jgi:hypothetical protein